MKSMIFSLLVIIFGPGTRRIFESIHPPGKPLSLGDVKNWLKSGSYGAYYHVLNHNCQQFCDAFWERFCY